MAARRVAVTGAGVVSPLGGTLQEFHRSLAAGRSGIRRLAPELAERSGVHVGATLDWDPATLFTQAEAANLDRVTQFALAATAQAIGASGLGLAAQNRERIGVYWGTGMGSAHTQETSYKQVYGEGEWRVRPLTVVMSMNNAAGSNVALRHGLRGPFANYSTACSSSAMALGEAMRTIAAGRAEAINALFGAAARGVPVSSTKSLHGHLLGGSGALEFAAALLALEGVAPPTGHLEQPDPACELRHVAREAERVAAPRAVMSNSFGFGGSNVV